MIKRKVKLLVIEDEEFDVRRIRSTLEPFCDQIQIIDITSNGSKAVELIEANPEKYDVIIMDFQIAGKLKGENLIRKIKSIESTLQVIVVTKLTIHNTDFEFANQLLEAGAFWYCTKYPGDIENAIYQPTDFVLSIFNACEKRHLERQKHKSDKKLQQSIQSILSGKKIIGASGFIKNLKLQIKQLAQSDTTVLIQGDSGTGKELVAAHIHYNSQRKYEKFVPVNCGLL
ncbi:sigma 54-interacting transcriptional regulator [candidate division KSB1 bacterium]|nr:sigma 54-interacting transcriptional regulator [candidate division KSB1 bacterium]